MPVADLSRGWGGGAGPSGGRLAKDGQHAADETGNEADHEDDGDQDEAPEPAAPSGFAAGMATELLARPRGTVQAAADVGRGAASGPGGITQGADATRPVTTVPHTVQ